MFHEYRDIAWKYVYNLQNPKKVESIFAFQQQIYSLSVLTRQIVIAFCSSCFPSTKYRIKLNSTHYITTVMNSKY